MLLRNRLAIILAAAFLLTGSAFFAGCGEEQAAETVTKKETKTVTNKDGDKTTEKTGTQPRTAPPAPAPAPTPAPAPAPATPAPAPGGGSTNQAADQADMVALIQSDPYYGGGDYYEVMAYDPNGTGTVLITTYYTTHTEFWEVYMSKDQYGWLAYDDYWYTIP
jgi:hypothetical protein